MNAVVQQDAKPVATWDDREIGSAKWFHQSERSRISPSQGLGPPLARAVRYLLERLAEDACCARWAR